MNARGPWAADDGGPVTFAWAGEVAKHLQTKERLQRAEETLARIEEIAQRGCTHYCGWYDRGDPVQCSVYDMVGYLRLILKAYEEERDGV